MELEIWGVRGTIPSPGADKVKYGGHTLCASLGTPDGETIVIDAGTGIKDLGDRIVAEKKDSAVRISLFLTHFHLDHIMGFPFFAPLYSPQTEITVYSAAGGEAARKALSGLMSGWYYPLTLDEAGARKEFKSFEEGLTIGGIKLSSCPLRHPQGSVAYKLETEEWSVIFATDTEHPEEGLDGRLVDFARGATHLFYDAMYTPEEYAAGKRGWGHSTWLEGTKVAAAAETGSLYLSHFNPAHTDEMIGAILPKARERFTWTYAARQGMKIF